MDDLTHLTNDHARYTDRWRATDRLAEQRVTVLVAAVTACIAIVAISDPGANTHQTRGGVWIFAAIISFGVFHRLVAARLSIIRSISILNLIRDELASRSSSSLDSYNSRVRNVDSNLPKYKLMSTPAAAALCSSACLALSLREIRLWGLSTPDPLWFPSVTELWIVPAAIFLSCTFYFYLKSQRFSAHLQAALL